MTAQPEVIFPGFGPEIRLGEVSLGCVVGKPYMWIAGAYPKATQG